MSNSSTYRRVIRTLLCCVAVLLSLGSMPSNVYAAPPVVNLVLGGEGSTSWNIKNIAPGDFGLKTVTLRNAGTSNGIVSIWISDVASNEGLNPESETGDINEPGEFTDYMLISLDANGLFTNIILPTTIYNLPQSILDNRYIRIPLQVADTVSLDWSWVLPEYTGNEAQGDSISFTIHYLLSDVVQGLPSPPEPPGDGGSSPDPPPSVEPPSAPEPPTIFLTTNMLGRGKMVEIGTDGSLLQPLALSDAKGNFVIEFHSGSRIIGSEGIPPKQLELTIAEESIATLTNTELPERVVLLSPIYRFTGYLDDVQVYPLYFTPFATLAIKYDATDLPENILKPFIAYLTRDKGLIPIDPPPRSLVEVGKAKAQLSHASLFVVAAELVPPPRPLPAEFQVSSLTISPQKSRPSEPVTISLTIANKGETEDSYELYLQIDGIVRMIKKVTLAPKTIKEVTFKVSDLAGGVHEVKIGDQTGQFEVIRMVTLPVKPTVNWLPLDLGIGAAILISLVALYLLGKRVRRLQSR